MATRIGARLPYRVFKDSGDVCTDATITFYLANSTTLQEVFSDKELTVTLGSTVSCNSVGVVPDIWVSDAISIKAIIAGTGVTSDTIDYLTVAASTVAGTTTGDFALGNAIVNGGLSAWTPGTSYSNISGSGTGVEVADDIYFVQSTAASNAISRQTANGTQTRYCMRVGRPASSTSTNKLRIWGTIPTDECYRLRGQEVTFSFRVKAGATFSGTALGVRIATGTTEAESGDLIEASGFAGNANPLNTTQAITTTATRYEFTCTLSSTLKNLGWQLAYTGVGTAGATDYFEVEDLQIEIASAATSFKVVPEPLDYLRANLTTGGRLVAASTFTDPGADRVLGWDDSAGAVIGYTFGTGITTNATAIELDADLVTWSGITPAAGIATWLAAPSSANLAAAMTDEVGTGALYFTGGALGTPASATLTNATGLPVSTGISGLGTGVATFLATPSASNLVAAVTGGTVWHSGNDGSGSGLDADLLDGLSSAAFAQLAAENIFTMSEAGDYQALAARNTSANSAAYTSIYLGNDTAANRGGMFMNSSANTNFGGAGSVNVGSFANVPVALVHNSVVRAYVSASGLTDASGNIYFTTANDGAGSGLDADLLDGQSSAYYLAASSYTAADVLSKLLTVDGAGSGLDADLLDGQSSAYYLAASSYTAADVLSKLLTVDGAGSGLDADLLDGKNISTAGNAIPLLDGANTWSAAQTQAISQNGGSYIASQNANTGSSARAGFSLGNNSSSLAGILWVNGSNTTDYAGAGSLNLGAITNTKLGFVQNDTLRYYIDTDGVLKTAAAAAVLTTATGAQLAAANTFTANQIINKTTPLIDFQEGGVLKGEIYYLSGEFGFYANTGVSTAFWSDNVKRVTIETGGDLRITAAPSSLATNSAGFRGVPLYNDAAINAAVTFAVGHMGKCAYHDEASARTWTIDSNANYAAPLGSTIVIDNTGNSGSAGTITLAITSDTLRRGDGVAGTGSRTIAAGQVAVARKTKTTEWVLTGVFS